MGLFTSPLFYVFIFLTLIDQSLSARILNDQTPSNELTQPSVTFYMNNILGQKYHTSPKPVATNIYDNQQLPFSKPIVFFPPNKAISFHDSSSGFSTQTLDFPGNGIAIPSKAMLEEMEFGSITVIDEGLFKSVFGSVFIGKAEGVYVASLEDGNSHMLAITVSFVEDEYKDELRLFGLYQEVLPESHVAVIGGTGKYENANGYATIRTVNVGSNVGEEKNSVGTYDVLLLNVYL